MSGALARLRYCIADAVDEWRHSPGVNVLAMTTLTAALIVAAITLLLLYNIRGHLDEWRQEFRLAAYLEDGISPETLARLKARLEKTPGVLRVEFVDKSEALVRFRRSFGELADLPERLGQNPLPASLEAYLAPDGRSAEVAGALRAALAKEPGIEEVRYDREWLDRLDSFLGVARWVGLGLALVVFCAVAFVMSSVMRLAVHARREEVEIMLLVGATPALVRGPFLVAGFFQGLAGTVIATALVESARRLAFGAVAPPPALLVLIAGRPLSPGILLVLLAAGLIVSCTSAFFAVRK